MIRKCCFLWSVFQISLVFASLLMTLIIQAQIPDDLNDFNPSPRLEDGARVVFYNVENLFDYEDDTLKLDEEYLPQGKKFWSKRKYTHKLQQLYKVLISVGGWEAPALIGLCEVENRRVLEDLTTLTGLDKFDYQIVHENSPDRRGIDVALLYRSDKFTPIHYETIPIRYPFDTASRTRDILYVKGTLLGQDTLHIFVNHWTSKYGGVLNTEPKRFFLGELVRQKADSIYAQIPNANIIIMGDLNDEPKDESVLKGLKAEKPVIDPANMAENGLYNLMYNQNKGGTHKFQEHWSVIDHLIVSPSLLQGKTGLKVSPAGAKIFSTSWLLEDETVRVGQKPFRTHLAFKYIGGYSDHLPIYMDVFLVR
ncbi:MAG: hypothetical protein ACPGXL_05655 [Chitinophagales bacterium]